MTQRLSSARRNLRVALPLAAICLVLLQEGKQAYLGSSFYRKR